MNRRDMMGAMVIATTLGPLTTAAAASGSPLSRRLAEIERRSGGRLGVSILDVASATRTGHRADERFPLCSTFKFLAAAAVLARVDRGQESLDQRVVFGATDLVPYSPATQSNVGGAGMSVAQLCEAAVTLSDNTAANLLLARLGGPAGVTHFARSIGDLQTRLDRTEPGLNEARAGDPRDTTTPDAMVHDLSQLLLGSQLTPASRSRLLGWLDANTTGDTRLRAGLPVDWQVGDKTGSGSNGTTNDIGILRPPGRLPILVAAYLTGSKGSADSRNATLAAVGKVVADALT